MNGCSIGIPAGGFALLAFSGAVSTSPLVDAAHAGRIQSPDIRPPKLFRNV
jgi:hypothetical protein